MNRHTYIYILIYMCERRREKEIEEVYHTHTFKRTFINKVLERKRGSIIHINSVGDA